MVKYVGLSLIVAAGVGLGLYASHRLTRRVRLLRQLERVMESLLRRLTYGARPMGEMWLQLAEDESFVCCPLVADTAAGLANAPFSEAFRRGVEKCAAEGLLGASERQLLLEFGAECGRYDLARQAAQIRSCIRGLQELCAVAAEQAGTRGQLYRVLGVAGGCGLALLLL